MAHPTAGLPDLSRAHGAWVYLFASIGGGALVGARAGVEVALLIGTAFTGGFLVTGALLRGPRRSVRQLMTGTLLAAGSPALALALGAERSFLWVGPLGALLALFCVVTARRRGLLSVPALVSGIAALTLASAATALAGGADLGHTALLFGALVFFFAWRSLRIAAPLRRVQGPWPADQLRRQGLREAGLAAVWTLAVVAVVA